MDNVILSGHEFVDKNGNGIYEPVGVFECSINALFPELIDFDLIGTRQSYCADDGSPILRVAVLCKKDSIDEALMSIGKKMGSGDWYCIIGSSRLSDIFSSKFAYSAGDIVRNK